MKVTAVVVFAFAIFFGVNILYLHRVIAQAIDDYPTVEEYTSSDKLLKRDGAESAKQITIFADEVKAAEEDTRFDELAEVIPAQYLNATEQNAVYQYNGKEYGFYVVKDGEYFDVLLIDFIYVFDATDHSDAEYLIKIKPILQQTFLRITLLNGQYSWKKVDAPLRYTYYVSNPRFLSALENENAYNAGDTEYVCDADEGLIIMQSRVNYGNIYYMDVDDLFVEITGFIYQQLRDDFVSTLDDVTAGLASVVYAVGSETRHIFEMSREGTLSTNNEANIFTNQSKETQKNTVGAYSRAAGFMPKQDIILSADENSYAEFITVLNDTNYTSRLTQICEFDIVRRVKPFGYIEDVENAGNLKFYKEQTLFEDKAPYFEISENSFENDVVNLYTLPDGCQKVKFRARYCGDYVFTVPNNLSFSINDNEYAATSDGKYTVRLNVGQVYYVTLRNNTSGVIKNATLTCRLKPVGNENFAINGYGNYVTSYTPDSDGVLKVLSSDENCRINILDDNLTELKTSSNNYCYYNFLKGKKYLIAVTNTLSSATDTSLSFVNGIYDTFTTDNDYTVAPVDNETYLKYNLDKGFYILQYKTTNTFNGCLQNNSLQTSYDAQTGVTSVEFYVSQENEDLTFVFSGQGNIDFKIYSVSKNYIWEVDGETYLTETATFGTRLDKNYPNRLVIQRGATATVKLKVGDIYVNKYIKVGSYNGYDYNASTSQLVIRNDCSLVSDESNAKYLLAFYGEYDIAALEIFVINDYETLSFIAYSDDDMYGLKYLPQTSVEKDVVTATIQIENIGGEIVCTLNSQGGLINVKDIVKNTNMPIDFTVTLTEVCVNGVPIYSTKRQLYISSFIGDNVFYLSQRYRSGQGTSERPYMLSCYRHLDNIRYNTSSNVYYEVYDDIDLANKVWTPIPVFSGTLNGMGNTIYNLNITIDNNSYVGKDIIDYGFIGELRGVLKSLRVEGLNISSNLSEIDEWIYVGAFAGYCNSAGCINDCRLYGANTINVPLYKSFVGGICGTNTGSITYCKSTDITMNVSGFAGGIAGENYGTIRKCDIISLIVNYYWNTDNGRIGGVVGYNTKNGSVTSCAVTGDMYWTSPSRNKNIKPSLGTLIGQNSGSYSDCSGVMGKHLDYHTQWMLPHFDQSDRCFKVDNGNVGYSGDD